MRCIDVFNGDADGICALHQLRLTYPMEVTLITGVKRDIMLLERVQAQPHDSVTVLNISIGQNRDALLHLLRLGVQVTYFDHHFTGTLTKHPGLTAIIDSSPDLCTSALVDRYLGGEHRPWAVVAAFGDGLDQLAHRLAVPLHLSAEKLDQLKQLGQCLNYNAYGDAISDLVFNPADLYRRMKPYADPFRFMNRESAAIAQLRDGRAADLEAALKIKPEVTSPAVAIYVLPDVAWSRRIRGELAHQLAQDHPSRAHAVLSPRAAGGFTVSVRAPVAKPRGADELCSQFPTGGGRPAAAGINELPPSEMEEFTRRFFAQYSL